MASDAKAEAGNSLYDDRDVRTYHYAEKDTDFDTSLRSPDSTGDRIRGRRPSIDFTQPSQTPNRRRRSTDYSPGLRYQSQDDEPSRKHYQYDLAACAGRISTSGVHHRLRSRSPRHSNSPPALLSNTQTLQELIRRGEEEDRIASLSALEQVEARFVESGQRERFDLNVGIGMAANAANSPSATAQANVSASPAQADSDVTTAKQSRWRKKMTKWQRR
jgi:hypothetical protein